VLPNQSPRDGKHQEQRVIGDRDRVRAAIVADRLGLRGAVFSARDALRAVTIRPRDRGITAYLERGGTLENAQAMAAHESPRTTKLYGRPGDQITFDEVEKKQI
jgi:hypothetical protein